MAQKDYYQILNVSRDATPEQIKSAYRKLARKHHPDVSKAPDAAERFGEATEAYDVLSDPEKRTLYDQFGHAGVKGAAGPGAYAGAGHPQGAKAGQNADFGDFFGGGGFAGMGLDELLDALRGSPGGGGRRGRRHTARTPAAPVGGNIEHHLTLDFLSAIRGRQQSLRLQTQDPQTGRERTETLTVKIPPGVDEGSRIRVRGKGQQGPGGAGDLHLVIHVLAHPYFRREGSDISVEVPISVTEAVLGASVDVPTLEGTNTVKIPPGTRSGARLRLRGQGVPGRSGEAAGDQYVVIRIVPPRNVSQRGRELMEEFARTDPLDPRAEAPWKT